MTFVEFLIKKKIDFALFKTNEPLLFSEFESHYSQMGEKSFDHSKKFWFNKLRRTYHLKEEAKPKEEPEVNPIASQAEPLISPTIEASGYKPRFKPKLASPETDNSSLETKLPDSPDKPVYKPRFKPGIIPPKQSED